MSWASPGVAGQRRFLWRLRCLNYYPSDRDMVADVSSAAYCGGAGSTDQVHRRPPVGGAFGERFVKDFDVIAEVPEGRPVGTEAGVIEIPDSGGERSRGFQDRCLIIEDCLDVRSAWVGHVNATFTRLGDDSFHDVHLHCALVPAVAVFLRGFAAFCSRQRLRSYALRS